MPIFGNFTCFSCIDGFAWRVVGFSHGSFFFLALLSPTFLGFVDFFSGGACVFALRLFLAIFLASRAFLDLLGELSDFRIGSIFSCAFVAHLLWLCAFFFDGACVFALCLFLAIFLLSLHFWFFLDSCPIFARGTN